MTKKTINAREFERFIQERNACEHPTWITISKSHKQCFNCNKKILTNIDKMKIG